MEEDKSVIFQSAKYPAFQTLFVLSHMEEIKIIKKYRNRLIHSRILMCLELRTFLTISLVFRVSKVLSLRKFEEREIQGLK